MFALKNKLMGIVNPGGGGAPKFKLIAEAVVGAAQSPTTFTNVVFGNTILNNGFTFDGTQVTITKDGIYNIDAFVLCGGGGNNGGQIRAAVNGTQVAILDNFQVNSSDITVQASSGNVDLSLSVGDVVAIQAQFSVDIVNSDTNNVARLTITEQ